MFAMVEATGELPKTSQPPLGDFLTIFKELAEQGKKVLMIALDGVLSGTVQTARLAARQVMKEVPGADIRVVDSLTTANPVSGMAMAVAAAVDAMKWHEVVGCIAGDDTIMCAIRTVEDTAAVMDKIRKIVSREV